MRFDQLSRLQKSLVVGTVAIALGAVLILLAEGGVRVRSYVKTGLWWGVEETYVVDKETGLRIPRPNLNSGAIEINSQGFRGPEINVIKEPGRIRLAFLGGSTTYCAEVSSNAMTWPQQVTEKLRSAYPGATFDYINGGVPGYATGTSLKNLTQRIAPYAPDIIVIYHATNDLSFNSFQAAVESGVATKRADEEKFWLSKYSLLSHLIELNLKIALLKQQDLAGAKGKLDVSPEKLVKPFAAEMADLIRASKEVSPIVAVATFSVQYRHDQSPEERARAASTSLYYMPYMTVTSLLDAFDAYNVAILEIATDAGVILIEGEHDIPGDAVHFNDSVHFKDAGSVAMADRVTRALLGSEEVRDLVGSNET